MQIILSCERGGSATLRTTPVHDVRRILVQQAVGVVGAAAIDQQQAAATAAAGFFAE